MVLKHGEQRNYHYDGRTHLKVGNTERLAQMISRYIDCDLRRILLAYPYSDDYEQTVQRNVREQDSDARPAIASPLPEVDHYDTVLLGSPIWKTSAHP
ncbi:flavodoxin [Actinomadura napierensis]|uniref:Flavodoxin-like domain-containing protein n=1 Tax=Actinomadura napierensis TaxID=267854 RepID=A0ABP5LS29_9ACTN